MRLSAVLWVLLLVGLGGLLYWATDAPPGVAPGASPGAAGPGSALAAPLDGNGGPAVPAATTTDRVAVPGLGDAAAAGAENDLHGTVTGPGGKPVAGAMLTATAGLADGYSVLDRALRRERREVSTTATGANGGYRLRLEPGRLHLVCVTAAGLVPQSRGSCLAGARADFVLSTGASLTGTVRHATTGATVPGTRVSVRKRLLLGGTVLGGSVTADGAGVYRLDDLPDGTVEVDVVPLELATPRSFELELHAGATTVHDISLTDGVTIRGFVRDAQSRVGIAGASVVEGLGGRTVQTGPDGAFTLVGFAPLANLSLTVHAAGYADVESPLRGRPSTPADTATEVEILLHKGRTARGIVQDAAGAPLAEVYVAAAAADHNGPNEWFRSDWRTARTRADGTFTIQDLRPDMQHCLMLLRPGLATAVYEFPADEAQHQEIDLGVFRLQPPASLAGTIRDDRGEPVADHEVTLQGANADRWRDRAPDPDGYRAVDGYVASRTCRTDDRGRFWFHDLAAGDYLVAAQKFDSHEQISVRRTVGPAEAASGVDLVLVRGFVIEGRVFVADGGVLPKCYCSIDPEDGQATSGDVEARADGTFHAGGLAAGNYSITVHPYASEADRAVGRTFRPRKHEHVAAGSKGLRCEVPVLGVVRGVLLDTLRAPVAGAWVAVVDGEEVVDSARTGPDGAFSLPSPAGKPVRVMACAPLAPPPGAASAFARERVVAQCQATAGGDPVELTLPAR